LLVACSGRGPGADHCETIEHAICDRRAECEDWSSEERENCRATRDAECHAGAIGPVRDAAQAEIDACAEAIGQVECGALDDAFAPSECAPLRAEHPEDAGTAGDAGAVDADAG
jgi:hypothetical protein